uniref:PDEase domain-containing protein n=1 Tax=Tetraselmis sp. GSL018 TaxID=582737 RepID=A0A061RJU6_9CHLO
MRKNEGSSHFAFGNPTSGAAEMHMSSSSGSAFGRITFKRGNKEVSSSSGPHPPSGLPSEPLPSNDFANWSEELKLLTLQLAIKTADIGHSFALWTDHTKWSEALQDEFFAQGRKEIAMGLPPSKLMDPNKPGVMDPMNQMAFFNVIAVVFPRSGTLLLDQGRSNLSRWQEMVQQQFPSQAPLPPPPRRNARRSIDLSRLWPGGRHQANGPNEAPLSGPSEAETIQIASDEEQQSVGTQSGYPNVSLQGKRLSLTAWKPPSKEFTISREGSKRSQSSVKERRFSDLFRFA